MSSEYFTKTQPKSDPIEKTGSLIWEKLFLVKIEQKYLQSEQELKIFGTPTTGDPYYDNLMHHQLIDIMIPINGMIEYYKKGITVRITKNSDTKLIYEIIRDYLHAWYNRIQNSVNVGDVPLDDLNILDEFASKIYPFARSHIKEDDYLTKIKDNFGLNSILSRNTLLKDQVIEKKKEEAKYESIADLINNNLNGSKPLSVNLPKSRWAK